jgi:hypothetical protein
MTGELDVSSWDRRLTAGAKVRTGESVRGYATETSPREEDHAIRPRKGAECTRMKMGCEERWIIGRSLRRLLGGERRIGANGREERKDRKLLQN